MANVKVRVAADIVIAQKAKLLPIEKIAQKIGLLKSDLELYGDYKAKIKYESTGKQKNKNGSLILVTAMTPTPPGVSPVYVSPL